MLRRAAILGAIVAALASAPAASAATKPIDLGPGTGAHAAIDSAGVAHLTWAERTSGQDVAHYCKLPQGAPACTTPHDFTYPTGPNLGTDSGVWPLLPGDP